jgi:hypothetical protein
MKGIGHNLVYCIAGEGSGICDHQGPAVVGFGRLSVHSYRTVPGARWSWGIAIDFQVEGRPGRCLSTVSSVRIHTP